MLKKINISKEITCLLVLKAILLFLIWYFCFSHPIDDHDVDLMSQKVDDHFGISSHFTHNIKVTHHD